MKFEVIHPKDMIMDDSVMDRLLFNRELAGLYLGTRDICVGYGSVGIKSPYNLLRYKKAKDIDKEQITKAMEGKCECVLPDRCELGFIDYLGKQVLVIAKYQTNSWTFVLRTLDTEFKDKYQ